MDLARIERLRKMDEEYKAAGPNVPAWLSALGQLDVMAALELERDETE